MLTDGTEIGYEYDSSLRLTKVSTPYGDISYVYNEVYQLISEKIVDKDSNVIEEYIYTLGKAGEKLKVTEVDLETEYTYDELYRLTGEKITKADGSVTETTYTYDKVGNRLTKTADGVVTEIGMKKANIYCKKWNFEV